MCMQTIYISYQTNIISINPLQNTTLSSRPSSPHTISSRLPPPCLLFTTCCTSGTTLSGITFATTSSNSSRPIKAMQKTVQDGSTDPFYWPAPMDFFRTALPLTPISVTSNGLRAVCNHVLPVSAYIYVCTSLLTLHPPAVFSVQTDASYDL